MPSRISLTPIALGLLAVTAVTAVAESPSEDDFCDRGSLDCAASDPDQIKLLQLHMQKGGKGGKGGKEGKTPDDKLEPKFEVQCFATGGPIQMWCPSKKKCTAVSKCPESQCVGVDAKGCNACDGELFCESAGECQYGSIPCFPKPGPTPKPLPILEPMCFATGGATQMWCPSKKECTAVSECPDSTCTGVTKRGCNACDGEVWCESAGKCQYGSIPCEGELVPAPPQVFCPIGGASQMWCPSKKKCTAVSKCPESECVGVDAHGCNSCDGEKWCEAAGKCQYGPIPCRAPEPVRPLTIEPKPEVVGGCAGTQNGCCPEDSWHPGEAAPGPDKSDGKGCYYYDLE